MPAKKAMVKTVSNHNTKVNALTLDNSVSMRAKYGKKTKDSLNSMKKILISDF